MENTFLSVIIPAYNEEARIKNTLEKIHSYLKNQDYTYEIIIVNDGSTDNTWALVNEIAQKIKEVRILKNEKNRGKGFTIKKGFFECQREISTFY